MFAIEFKEKKYESMEEHLHKIIKHAKEALECIKYGESYYSVPKHDSECADDVEVDHSRY